MEGKIRWCLHNILQKRGKLGVVISHTGVQGDLDVFVAVLVQRGVALPDVSTGLFEVKPLAGRHHRYLLGIRDQCLEK